jgi:hypothetical protein
LSTLKKTKAQLLILRRFLIDRNHHPTTKYFLFCSPKYWALNTHCWCNWRWNGYLGWRDASQGWLWALSCGVENRGFGQLRECCLSYSISMPNTIVLSNFQATYAQHRPFLNYQLKSWPFQPLSPSSRASWVWNIPFLIRYSSFQKTYLFFVLFHFFSILWIFLF